MTFSINQISSWFMPGYQIFDRLSVKLEPINNKTQGSGVGYQVEVGPMQQLKEKYRLKREINFPT